MTLAYPLIVTMHANEVLQIADVETKQVDQFSQAHGSMLSGSSSLRHLLCNTDFIVGLGPRRAAIWDRHRLSQDLPGPAKELELTGAPKSQMNRHVH